MGPWWERRVWAEMRRKIKSSETSNITGRTVPLTSIGNPVPGNQEFCLASSKTMVEQVKKNEKSHSEHGFEDEDLGRYVWS